jgi:hypothetical protein
VEEKEEETRRELGVPALCQLTNVKRGEQKREGRERERERRDR